MKTLKIDSNLYSKLQVRNVVDFINDNLVVDYYITEESYVIQGTKYFNLSLNFTTYTDRKRKFNIHGLYEHNKNVIIENIESFYK